MFLCLMLRSNSPYCLLLLPRCSSVAVGHPGGRPDERCRWMATACGIQGMCSQSKALLAFAVAAVHVTERAACTHKAHATACGRPCILSARRTWRARRWSRHHLRSSHLPSRRCWLRCSRPSAGELGHWRASTLPCMAPIAPCLVFPGTQTARPSTTFAQRWALLIASRRPPSPFAHTRHPRLYPEPRTIGSRS